MLLHSIIFRYQKQHPSWDVDWLIFNIIGQTQLWTTDDFILECQIAETYSTQTYAYLLTFVLKPTASQNQFKRFTIFIPPKGGIQ